MATQSSFPNINLPGIEPARNNIFSYAWLRFFQDIFQRTGSGPGFASTPWTPTDASGAGLVFTGVSGAYLEIGDLVWAYAQLTYPATANASAASIVLPVAAGSSNYATVPGLVSASGAFGNGIVLRATAGAAVGNFRVQAADAAITNAGLSGLTLAFMLNYPSA